MTDFTIRPYAYTEDDAAKLAVMWNESDDQWPGTFTGGVPLTTERVREWMDKETGLAILVVDDWQNRGVGNALTDCCLEIARKWGMKRIVAVTTADNARILTMFQKRDFKLEYGSDSMVEITREL